MVSLCGTQVRRAAWRRYLVFSAYCGYPLTCTHDNAKLDNTTFGSPSKALSSSSTRKVFLPVIRNLFHLVQKLDGIREHLLGYFT